MKKAALTALLCTALLQAAPLGPPQLRFSGSFTNARVQCAVLQGERPYVVRAGTPFGPYAVKSITPEQVLLEDKTGTYPYRFGPVPPPAPPVDAALTGGALPNPASFRMDLAYADLPSALKLYSHGTDTDLVSSADLPEPRMRFSGTFSNLSVLSTLLQPVEGDYAVDNGVLVVAPARRLPEVQTTYKANLLALRGVATTRCTVDLTHAKLADFLDIVATHEGGLTMDASIPKGTVSCRLRNRPASEILALCLAAQDPSLMITPGKQGWTLH